MQSLKTISFVADP